MPAPAKVNETLVKIITETDPVKLHGYTSAAGDIGVRSAIASYLNNKYNAGVGMENIYMTVGAAASLTISLTALVNDGDEVIVLAPFFPEYRVFAEKAGAKLVVVQSDPKDFQIDFDALESAINKNTKAIIVNSPNNPTGAVLTIDTIKKLAKLLEDKQREYGKDIYIISDEPYRELVYDLELHLHIQK